MFIYGNWLHVQKNPAKNCKVEFFGYLAVCIGVVFKKSNDAKAKISSNHLKFYTLKFRGCWIYKHPNAHLTFLLIIKEKNEHKV